PSVNPVSPEKAIRQAYRPIHEGERWGESWHNAWFRAAVQVPDCWQGRELALHIAFNGEVLLFDEETVPKFAFTNLSVFDESYSKEYYQLGRAKGGERLEFLLEGACNYLGGLRRCPDPGRKNPHPRGYINPVIDRARLAVFHTELWHLRLDLQCIASLAKTLPTEDYRRKRLLKATSDALDAYAGIPDNAGKARKQLTSVLSWQALASAPIATATGHAHIDVGWLWPVRESIRKAARTYASQLDLMDRYPEYVFAASQPQLYEFVKKHYPKLYEKIRQRVAEGRWEPQGGMWVEADCNLISGESMVRQFLFGKNFFRDEFGVDVKSLWLPDTFGYPASLPQFIHKSGCDYFLSQKISWSQFNQFPHHSFWWRGVDGTEVLAHFLPENTYNSKLLPGDLCQAQNRHSEIDIAPEFLVAFGIGDGGGGPAASFIERGRRNANWEGVPKVRFGRSDKFFQELATKYGNRLPRWVGELYLEVHRGTFTSQARVKCGNRKLEQTLASVEFVSSLLPQEEYPRQALSEIWKILLVNQFHDILPGSSITEVYEQTAKEYQMAMEKCGRLLDKAGQLLFHPQEGTLSLLNTLSYAWHNPMELPEGYGTEGLCDQSGHAIPVQVNADGRAWALVTIPPLGILQLRRDGQAKSRPASAHGCLILENNLVRYEFNEHAVLLHAWDKEYARDILSGAGNVLSLYHDRPNNCEAWDVDVFYQGEFIEHPVARGTAQAFTGPVYNCIHFQLQVGESAISQEVRLAPGNRRLDFVTHVDWRESRRMLRVAFPANVQTNEASCEIPYATIRRPTHENTNWEVAKFEVPAQRFVDMSDSNYGVALLNDCKYGHRLRNTTLDLNLLRSPRMPDWEADKGHHDFTYSLLPHPGGLDESPVRAEAAQLNRPPLLFVGVPKDTLTIPVSLSSGNISLETIKRAEKDDDLILRLVETTGRFSNAILILHGDYTVTETNLIELEQGKTLPANGRQVELSLRPFEILTLRLHSSDLPRKS
ncbi:MAG: alpha-mannosidase, partial [Victivallales bacterium]|nr:alpha-mannosidase [Victivallales bacterium]